MADPSETEAGEGHEFKVTLVYLREIRKIREIRDGRGHIKVNF